MYSSSEITDILKAEPLFAVVLEQSGDCIKLMSPLGELEFINAAGLRNLEIESFEEICGLRWGAFWPEEAHATVNSAIAKAGNGEKAAFEGFCPTAKGTPRWWDVRITPVFGKRGKVSQLLATSRDVSHKYVGDHNDAAAKGMLNKHLAAKSRLLDTADAGADAGAEHEEKLRFVGQFVGKLVHDLNNILASTRGASALLRRRIASETAKAILDHLDVAVDRGIEITRQVLDFSRAQPVVPIQMDLGEAICHDKTLLELLCGEKCNIIIDCEENLPRVFLSATLFQSMIFNLVANSRDAMPGGGTISIALSSSEMQQTGENSVLEKGVVLAVTDTGIGMPAEVVSRLGEPFFTTKPTGKGTGLGMSSIFELARSVGGKVDVFSEEQVGTKVSVTIPVKGDGACAANSKQCFQG